LNKRKRTPIAKAQQLQAQNNITKTHNVLPPEWPQNIPIQTDKQKRALKKRKMKHNDQDDVD
jgi:hypothetical protein